MSDHPKERVTIDAAQSIKTCRAVAEDIAGKLHPGNILVVDVSAFQTGDITFVQTLISARKSAGIMGARLDITPANAALKALFERCGLEAEAHLISTDETREASL